MSKIVQWRSRMPGASISAAGRPRRRGRPVAFQSSAGGSEGDRGVVFPQSSVLLRRHEGQVDEQGYQNHSTSCLFLQRFVESEREFLNSLFLINRSTFVLHRIPLSESLLVASSILCIPFFSCMRAFYSSSRVPNLHFNCHHVSVLEYRLPITIRARFENPGYILISEKKTY